MERGHLWNDAKVGGYRNLREGAEIRLFRGTGDLISVRQVLVGGSPIVRLPYIRNEYIANLRIRIAVQTRVDRSQQRLIFNGQQIPLDRDATRRVEDVNIRGGTTIDWIHRLRGS